MIFHAKKNSRNNDKDVSYSCVLQAYHPVTLHKHHTRQFVISISDNPDNLDISILKYVQPNDTSLDTKDNSIYNGYSGY